MARSRREVTIDCQLPCRRGARKLARELCRLEKLAGVLRRLVGILRKISKAGRFVDRLEISWEAVKKTSQVSGSFEKLLGATKRAND